MPRPDQYATAVWDQGHTWSFSEDNVPLLLGNRVVFTSPGVVVGMMYLRHPNDVGLHIGVVNETTGGPLLAWSIQSRPLNTDHPEFAQWHKLYLHPRFRPVVDTEYEIGVWFEKGKYAYEHNALDSEVVVGPITFPANDPDGNRNGVFTEPAGPSEGFQSGFSSSQYGIDILFLEDV